MVSAMTENTIARKLVVLVLALTLMVGGVSVAMASAGMNNCDLAMDSMANQASMSQDQPGMPMPDHQMPCKDMGGVCAATCGCAINLSQVEYYSTLSFKTASSDWGAQAELPRISSRPELPPPITLL
jgi:hypothetical protein